MGRQQRDAQYGAPSIKVGQAGYYGVSGWALPLGTSEEDLALYTLEMDPHNDYRPAPYYQPVGLRRVGTARTVSGQAKVEVTDIGGGRRLTMARVRVLEGPSTGQEGWVWAHHLWDGTKPPKAFQRGERVFPEIRHWHSQRGIEWRLD